ncbi:MauE/DoxX family redox-associated membrane protein [Nocardia goodfellowii]
MSEYGVWVARLVVAVVFGWAAVAKLSDRAATRRAVEDFGVPARWAGVAVWCLPAVELVVAVCVLPSWTAVWAGGAALILLAAFTIAVAALLARGQRPACSCFGAASAAPIGRATLLRNAAIAAVTGLLVWGSVTYDEVPQQLPVDRAAGLAALVGLAAWTVRQQLEIRRLRGQVAQAPATGQTQEGLPVGVPAPEFELHSTVGRHQSLAEAVATGLPVLLLFVSTRCGACADIAADVAGWRTRLDGAVSVLVIGNGDMAANIDWAREHGVGHMLVQHHAELISEYRLRGAPSAVLVDTRGRIASPTRGGPEPIRDLVEGIASDLRLTPDDYPARHGISSANRHWSVDSL